MLEGRKPDIVQGNLLIDYLLGADVLFAPTREAQRGALDEQAARVRAAGGRPHILNDNPMFGGGQDQDPDHSDSIPMARMLCPVITSLNDGQSL